MEHTRIDEGFKRKAYAPQARDPQTHRFLSRFTPEQRESIVQDALDSLTLGETTDDIAARYDCAGSVLRTWLLADDRADKARAVYFAQELNQARDRIQAAEDPLTLARAREDFRSIAWLAERRNAATWGQKQEVNVTVDIGSAIQRISERLQQTYPQADEPKLLNNEAESEVDVSNQQDTI